MKPTYAGSRDRTPVYPASLKKLWIAASLLNEVAHKRLWLHHHIFVAEHNVRPADPEVAHDVQHQLQADQMCTVGYLLDLMITRSDDTAANVLIDLLGRDRINRFIQHYGWYGSEVTRKFLPRKLEDVGYERAPVTMTTTRHLAEFLYRLVSQRMLDATGSQRLMELLYRQVDRTKLVRGLSARAVYAHKTGWFEDPSKDKNKKKIHSTGDCAIIHFDRYHQCLVAAIVEIPGAEGEEVLCELGRRLECVVKRFRQRVPSV